MNADKLKNFHLPLYVKILLAYTPSLILVLTVIFQLFVSRWSRAEENSHYNLMAQMNTSLADNFAQVAEDSKRLAKLHYLDQEVLNILTNQYLDEQSYYNDLIYIKDVIRRSTTLSPYLCGVTFIGENMRVYDNSGGDREYLSSLQYLNQYAEDSGEYISKVYTAEIKHTPIQVITLCEKMMNPYNNRHAGYASLSIDFNMVFKLYADSKSDSPSSFFITKDDRVLFSSSEDKDEVECLASAILRDFGGVDSTVGRFMTNLGSEKFIISHFYDPVFDYHIFRYMPYSVIGGSISNDGRFYMILVAVIVFLALFIGFLFSTHTLKPLNEILSTMKNTKESHFSPITTKRRDELGLIIKGVNQMMLKLRQSQERELQFADKEKQYHLKILQAQINPHFICNTLSLISSISSLESNETVTQISNSLSRMLYYNLKGSDHVTIREEIEQYKRYVGIQKMRFPGRFSDHYDIDDKLLTCPAIKFILQPVAENAFAHGLINKVGIGMIGLSVKQEGSCVTLVVYDDGIGIEEDRIQKIQKSLNTEEDEFLLSSDMESVGLLNVHYRLRNVYGKAYGLSIESKKNEGTRIILKYPMYQSFAIHRQGKV